MILLINLDDFFRSDLLSSYKLAATGVEFF